jgi:hypothetical protein
MAAEGAAVVRPRTTGELLDDAWRLYFADAPWLLLLSSLFLAPAFGALLLLAGLPAPTSLLLRFLPPLLPLPLLVLTGVGSGACQEWLRARAEGRAPSFAGSLTAAFRRGLSHAAARAVVLVAPLLGLGMWLSGVAGPDRPHDPAAMDPTLARVLLTGLAVLPGLLLWPLTATIHALLASSKTRSLAAVGEYLRQARYDARKTGVVTLSRAAVLALAVINLHLLVEVGLWVLNDLTGLDAAFVALQLTIANPIYDLALVLFAWLLLSPFFEACNFLTHVDARTRQEGLDLQVRVQHLYPTVERQRVGALAALAGILVLGAAPARANIEYDAVHAARMDVERIAQEAKAAEPYNGAIWQVELDQAASALERAGGRDRFTWFQKAIDRFGRLPKNDALTLLSDLDDRLALLEDTLPHEGAPKVLSKDDLKRMLQQPGADRPRVDVQPEDDTDKPKDKKKPDDDKQDQPDDQGDGAAHPALIGPGAIPAGCGQVGLMVLGGLALAVLLVGAALFIVSRSRGPQTVKTPLVPAKTMQLTTERREPMPHERPASELWREADEQARNEQYLQAVRTLYLAVLSMLHRRQLLRFEPMRTNGEYLQQVRLAPQAPAELHAVFEDFTSLFERKWYGDRACDAEEFRAARGLAEEMQGLVRET